MFMFYFIAALYVFLNSFSDNTISLRLIYLFAKCVVRSHYIKVPALVTQKRIEL